MGRGRFSPWRILRAQKAEGSAYFASAHGSRKIFDRCLGERFRPRSHVWRVRLWVFSVGL